MLLVSPRLTGMGFAACIKCGASGVEVPFRMVLLDRPEDRLKYVCEGCGAGIPEGKVDFKPFEPNHPDPAFERIKRDLFEGMF